METKRQNKISKLLQKDIGSILQLESRNLFGGAMITVTKVNVTPDLTLAKIYVSIFASKDNDECIKSIRIHSKEIRHQLAQRVKHQLRAVPELNFYLDDSLDYIENIDNLLNE
jgi:ribosome-binding factor A